MQDTAIAIWMCGINGALPCSAPASTLDHTSTIFEIAVTHPFLSGFAIGGLGFGGSLGIIGWCLGQDAAMRRVGAWMRPKMDEAHGDVPTLPPVRERRLSSVAHREWLS